MIRRLQIIQQQIEDEKKKRAPDDGSSFGAEIVNALADGVNQSVPEDRSLDYKDSPNYELHRRTAEFERQQYEYEKAQAEKVQQAWMSRDHIYTVHLDTLSKVQLPPKLAAFAYQLQIEIRPTTKLSDLLKLADRKEIPKDDLRHLIKLGVLRSVHNPIDEQTYIRRIAAANRSMDAYKKRKEESYAARELCRNAGRMIQRRGDRREVRIEKKDVEKKILEGVKTFRRKLRSTMSDLVRQELKHFPTPIEDVLISSKKDFRTYDKVLKQESRDSEYPKLPHLKKHLAWTSTLGNAEDVAGLKTALERPFDWTPSNIKNGFFHLVITSVPGQEASNEQMVTTAQRCMARCGIDLDSHAIQIYIHEDKPGHKHAHVIGNRVAVDGSYFAGHPTAMVMACSLERSIINKQHAFHIPLDPITPRSPDQRRIWKELCEGSLCSEYRGKGMKSRTVPITGTAAAERIKEVSGLDFDVPVGLVKFQYLQGNKFDLLHYTS